MKTILKKTWQALSGINGLLLVCCLMFAFTADVLISVPMSGYYLIFSMLFFAGISVAISILAIRFLSQRDIRLAAHGPSDTTGKAIGLKLAFYGLPFAIFMLHYFAWYPGGYSFDGIEQYAQAVTHQYNDWHPVMHTLVAFTLPLTLTGGWSGSVVLFQMLAFSLVLGYLFTTVYQYTSTKYTLISMAFLLLNPQMGGISIFPWKDVGFAIGALLLLTYAFRIYVTKGVWLKKPVHAVFFVLCAALTTLFRHNALLFTIPLVIAVALCVSKKRGLLLCLSVLVLCTIVKGPVYSAIGVEQPGKRQIETLGLPMSVIGAAVSDQPEALDEETLEFAYRIAPKQVWEEIYFDAGFNSIKFLEQTNCDVIEEYGAARVLSIMFKCIKAAPSATLKGLIQLTKAVYTLTSDYDEFIPQWIESNEFGLTPNGNPNLVNLCEGYRFFVLNWMGYPFLHLGFLHLVLIASVLAKCNLRKRKDWHRVLWIVPVLAYNFGTTLLLTGRGDASRFFYYTYLLFPLLLLFLFGKNDERKADSSAPQTI